MGRAQNVAKTVEINRFGGTDHLSVPDWMDQKLGPPDTKYARLGASATCGRWNLGNRFALTKLAGFGLRETRLEKDCNLQNLDYMSSLQAAKTRNPQHQDCVRITC